MIGVLICTPISQYFTTVCTDIQRCAENEAALLWVDFRHTRYLAANIASTSIGNDCAAH